MLSIFFKKHQLATVVSDQENLFPTHLSPYRPMATKCGKLNKVNAPYGLSIFKSKCMYLIFFIFTLKSASVNRIYSFIGK